jgi:hypothetical protein
MKTFRYLTLIASAVTLTLLAIGTANSLIEFNALHMVWEEPGVLLLSYYQTLGEMGLNYDWFANYGPLAVVGLIAALFVASLP